MASATITTKGQITLPKQIRDRLGLRTGDRVSFRERADHTIVVEPETSNLLELRGSVRSRVRGVSLEAMNQAIKKSATRR